MDEKKPYTILYVEDEKAIRDNYLRYLNRHFTSVYEAEDGEQAYKIYQDVKPQIMIIDINIPKLNGLELLKKIRQNDHTTKAIMLTAHADVKYLLSAIELKLTKYLVKPVSRDDLKNALYLAEQELEDFDIISTKTIALRDKLTWSYELQELKKDNVTVSLTNKEKILLSTLLDNPNKVLTYESIIEHIWIDAYEDKLNPLKTIIKNIRKKLPKDMIQNVFGIGFKITTTN